MDWEKEGRIIEPTGDPWMRTHAMLPVADHRQDSIYRVYFSGRDDQNRSHIAWAEIDIEENGEVQRFSDGPVLEPGELGCFDDNGVTPSWIVDTPDRKHLYYIGWNPTATVRMYLYGSVAFSEDGGESFERHARVPVFDRIHEEPFLNTAPCVHRDGEDEWKVWYVSGIEWVHPDLPKYNIRYAESDDGVHWERPGEVVLDLSKPNERALARPCVRKESGTYKMWFSHKGEAYRIGYAESEDGRHWKRDDEKGGLDVSEDGWDSEMVEYSYVFYYAGNRYMLYNGNDYGREGIGLAVES